jgi:hypothetical protein
MTSLKTLCPVCESDIEIPSRDIQLAVKQKGKTQGKAVVGCPACARVLVVEDVPEKDVSQWIETVSESDDWLGCIPLMDPEQAKAPTGYIGDLAFRRYKAGQGGEPLPRREYMMAYGIDPVIHIALNPGMSGTPFNITDSRR